MTPADGNPRIGYQHHMPPEETRNRYVYGVAQAFAQLEKYTEYVRRQQGIGDKLVDKLRTLPDNFLLLFRLGKSNATVGYALIGEQEQVVLAFVEDGEVKPLNAHEFRRLMLPYEDEQTARPGFRRDGVVELYGISTIDRIVHELIGTPRNTDNGNK